MVVFVFRPACTTFHDLCAGESESVTCIFVFVGSKLNANSVSWLSLGTRLFVISVSKMLTFVMRLFKGRFIRELEIF